jgi:hypothetical protein
MNTSALFLIIFIWVVSAVDVGEIATIPTLFEFEKFQFYPKEFEATHQTVKNDLNTDECKAFPGDAGWPRDEKWSDFNTTLNGTLLKPAPLASICYKNTTYGNFDSSECEILSSKWQNGSGIER